MWQLKLAWRITWYNQLLLAFYLLSGAPTTRHACLVLRGHDWQQEGCSHVTLVRTDTVIHHRRHEGSWGLEPFSSQADKDRRDRGGGPIFLHLIQRQTCSPTPNTTTTTTCSHTHRINPAAIQSPTIEDTSTATVLLPQTSRKQTSWAGLSKWNKNTNKSKTLLHRRSGVKGQRSPRNHRNPD